MAKERIGNGHPLLYIGKNYGKPPKYKTVREFWDKAIEYFEQETSKTGICKATRSGLCFHLGFNSYHALQGMKRKDAHNDEDENGNSWKYAVEQMELFMENCFERQLYNPQSRGAEFWLKNHNPAMWKDEVTQNQNIKAVTANFGTEPNNTDQTENAG